MPKPLSLDAPRPPEVLAPHRFPVIATIAPLVVSLALFAATRSVFSLVFAALGPVVAVGSSVDAMVQRRRTRRREAVRFAAEVTAAGDAISAAHHDERRAADAESPAAEKTLENTDRISRRWRASTDEPVSVRLGVATVPSSLRYNSPRPNLQESRATTSTDPTVNETLAHLRDRARSLDDAPIVATVHSGIGVVGRPLPATAVARAVLVQLAGQLSPAEWSLTVPDGDTAQWTRGLPHAVQDSSEGTGVRFSAGKATLSVATARSIDGLPRELDVILELGENGGARFDSSELFPGWLGIQEATAAAAELADLAGRLGVRTTGASRLPAELDFCSVHDAGRASGMLSNSLGAAVGMTGDGVLLLDLASDGPHAIVGGTTGSGKSELLLSWVLGMAADRSPDQVTFLFVDFKGGASFGSLLDLPHSVGVLTDLDTEQSLRALVSLTAELRYRERELASHGLRSLDEGHSPPFPRLVVVVDEYAALLEIFPTLHGLFTDIAARGRSLGVHLVLCTQRPAGVVRDGILANTPMRISLRVTNPADSVAVLGTDAAAELSARLPGRALLSRGGESPVLFQVARSSAADVARVAEKWSTAPRPRAPWLPPLARRIPLSELADGPVDDGIPFALADLPEQQQQRPARYRPREHGSLLVVGAGRSGKSGVLAALAAARSALEVVLVPSSVPAYWDALTVAPGAADATERLLLLDDVDSVIAGCAEIYQSALIDLIGRVLRDGPAVGVWCVLTAQRLGGGMHPLVSLCGSTLTLRMPSRAEHALAGGDPASFVQNLAPGAGHWRGDRIQVAMAPGADVRPTTPRATLVDPAVDPITVVSSHPERFVAALRDGAPERDLVLLSPVRFGEPATLRDDSGTGPPPVVLADPDSWQSQWSLFGTLRRSSTVLFDGVSVAEFRALTRSRELPPPFANGERALWALTPDGVVSRARLANR